MNEPKIISGNIDISFRGSSSMSIIPSGSSITCKGLSTDFTFTSWSGYLTDQESLANLGRGSSPSTGGVINSSLSSLFMPYGYDGEPIVGGNNYSVPQGKVLMITAYHSASQMIINGFPNLFSSGGEVVIIDENNTFSFGSMGSNGIQSYVDPNGGFSGMLFDKSDKLEPVLGGQIYTVPSAKKLVILSHRGVINADSKFILSKSDIINHPIVLPPETHLVLSLDNFNPGFTGYLVDENKTLGGGIDNNDSTQLPVGGPSSVTTSMLSDTILKYLKPEITSQPVANPSQLLPLNGTLFLNAYADGKYLNYQWFLNEKPIDGANSSHLTIHSLNKTLHEGNYTLVVSNDFGPTTSLQVDVEVQGADFDTNNGLVAYYSFDGDASDKTGNGNDGVVFGASLTNDRFGIANKAYSFDGVDDYIEVPFNQNLNTDSFTVSIWAKPIEVMSNRANSQNVASIVTSRDVSPTSGFSIYQFSDDKWRGQNGPTGDHWYTTFGTDVIINNWINIILIHSSDNNITRLFQNGIFVGESNSSFYSNKSKPLRVGAGGTESNSPQYFFPGEIDDLRIYNRAISENEINFLYNTDKPASQPGHTININSSVELDMIWVDPGSFSMGRSSSEFVSVYGNGHPSELIEQNTTIPDGFYLGKYEVTQAQYEAVMTGNTDGLSATPSRFVGDPNMPVEQVSWDDVQVFLDRLNAQQSDNIPVGWEYVLPTEAQWEYACRAGTKTAYSWGDTVVSSKANFDQSGYSQTRIVGQYSANPWGFFDMHGNVGEWTTDSYQYAGTYYIHKGGGFGSGYIELRSAARSSRSGQNNSGVGFRLAYINTGEYTVDLNSSVNLEMIWVEPGTFTMGSPTTEAGRNGDENEHNVTLTKGFYLGKYEVTQAQYEAVMTGNTDGLSTTPSNWPGNPNRPVEQVSWDDIQIFLSRLNTQQSANIPAGWAYVLPTESQWEYACRAGTRTAYSWRNDINSTDANYNWDGEWNTGSDFKQTRDVGQYTANPWGFFDMHGNAWEWTADWYGTYPAGNLVIDPTGEASGSSRVGRGGSWRYGGERLRSAERDYGTPSDRNSRMGFRVGFQYTGGAYSRLKLHRPL